MSTPQCEANIRKEPPPYNVECTSAFCVKTRPARDAHCTNSGKSPDTPVLTWDPALDSSCYCCCSCFTLNTPIAVANDEFVFIQDIVGGNTILTTGLDLVWKPGKVESRSGDILPTMVPSLYLLRYKMATEQKTRDMIVTADHLFMMAGDKTLKKVQHLIPNNALLSADGSIARVVFVAIGQYETAIQSIEMEGVFDGSNLDGHLINANGIVTTDFKVQAYYEAFQTTGDRNWVPKADIEVLSVGEPDYIQKFNSDELDKFLDDPKLWPKDFCPTRKQLMNIPANAKVFITPEQALEVNDNGTFFPVSSSDDTILKLLDLYQSRYPNIYFIFDKYNESPNAYSWNSGNQKYLVVTGKFSRLKDIYTDGFSLIIADMISRLVDNNCVAEGDYNAFNIMRLMWPNSILATMAPNSIKEVNSAVFKLIKINRDGNKNLVCQDPSIECRVESFQAGLSFFPMPSCGVPPSQTFNIKNAYANFELTKIEIIFSEDVELASGSTTLNYSITNDISITNAEVLGNKVELTVDGLAEGNRYIVEVSNVNSIYNVMINPNPSLAIISTIL